MNQPSVFQAKYPLSSRKFWKKTIPKIITFIIFATILIFVPVFLPAMITDTTPSSGILLKMFSAVIILFFITLFPYMLYIKVYIRRYYYDCGDQFITIKKGVFAPTEIHVQYQKIQDVYVDQDILDRIMGLYDVHIASATATSGIEAHIDGVNADVAENLKNIILSKIHNIGNPTTSAPTSVSQSQQPPISPIRFSQKISSETYPMDGAWIWSALIGSIVSSFFLTFIVLLFVKNWIDLINLNPIQAFIFLFVVVFIFEIIYKSIWKQNFYFEFTQDFILLKTGVISKQENHLPYKSIQNILNNQSILDRILGLATVTIQNAAVQMVPAGRGQSALEGSGIDLVWQSKAKAEELNAILNDIVIKVNPQNQINSMGL